MRTCGFIVHKPLAGVVPPIPAFMVAFRLHVQAGGINHLAMPEAGKMVTPLLTGILVGVTGLQNQALYMVQEFFLLVAYVQKVIHIRQNTNSHVDGSRPSFALNLTFHTNCILDLQVGIRIIRIISVINRSLNAWSIHRIHRIHRQSLHVLAGVVRRLPFRLPLRLPLRLPCFLSACSYRRVQIPSSKEMRGTSPLQEENQPVDTGVHHIAVTVHDHPDARAGGFGGSGRAGWRLGYLILKEPCVNDSEQKNRNSSFEIRKNFMAWYKASYLCRATVGAAAEVYRVPQRISAHLRQPSRREPGAGNIMPVAVEQREAAW
ncbi:hypothetical protein DFS34DRAFT_94701 [Phlyctochytrium arcticum]|nr:hypothetical protein DFS34DRAFT_94701 [Phlyctochytrium arcticum]